MSETLENVVAVEAIKEAEEAAKEEVAIEVATAVEPESLQYFPQREVGKQYGAFIFFVQVLMLTTHDYLKSIKIDRFPKETVYLVDFKKKPENNKIIFTMRDLVNRIIVGKQDRFCNPTYHDLKSKT